MAGDTGDVSYSFRFSKRYRDHTAYRSLASLNQTSIGNECSHLAGNGVCNSFEYVQQTGWFWDSAGRTLTVHYLGGANVTLTVIEQP